MSGSNWLRSLACLGIFLIGISLAAYTGVFIWDKYNLNKQRQHEHAENSERKRELAANEIASKCNETGRFNADFQDCISQEMQSYESKQTTNKDLQAQQDMAFWALYLFLVSIFGLIISMAGLLGIFTSLAQTRRALEFTKKQSDLDEEKFAETERPYLYLKVTDMSKLSNNQGIQPQLSYTIVNHGKTPAIMGKVFTELVPMGEYRRGPDGAINLTGYGPGDKWNPDSQSIVLHCAIHYFNATGTSEYSHHFELTSYCGRPFRLGYSEHKRIDSKEGDQP